MSQSSWREDWATLEKAGKRAGRRREGAGPRHARKRTTAQPVVAAGETACRS